MTAKFSQTKTVEQAYQNLIKTLNTRENECWTLGHLNFISRTVFENGHICKHIKYAVELIEDERGYHAAIITPHNDTLEQIQALINAANSEALRRHFTPAPEYDKKLTIGVKNIYLASKVYGHQDYNKSSIAPNTPQLKELADVLNSLFNL